MSNKVMDFFENIKFAFIDAWNDLGDFKNRLFNKSANPATGPNQPPGGPGLWDKLKDWADEKWEDFKDWRKRRKSAKATNPTPNQPSPTPPQPQKGLSFIRRCINAFKNWAGGKPDDDTNDIADHRTPPEDQKIKQREKPDPKPQAKRTKKGPGFIRRHWKGLGATVVAGTTILGIPATRNATLSALKHGAEKTIPTIPGVRNYFPEITYAETRKAIDAVFIGQPGVTVLHNDRAGVAYVLLLPTKSDGDKLANPSLPIKDIHGFTAGFSNAGSTGVYENGGFNKLHPEIYPVTVNKALVVAEIFDAKVATPDLIRTSLGRQELVPQGAIPDNGRFYAYISASPSVQARFIPLLHKADVTAFPTSPFPGSSPAKNRRMLMFVPAGNERNVDIIQGILQPPLSP